MSSYKSDGIVIRQVNVGEADQILTLYTRDYGKIDVIAKGVRKMNSRKLGNLELLAYSDLLLANGQSLDLVLEASVVLSYGDIRNDLTKTAYAYMVAEAFNRLVPLGLAQQRLFKLLKSYLTLLDQTEKPYQWFHLTQAVLYQLLQALGFLPELLKCVHCDRWLDESTTLFAPNMGGFLCAMCGQNLLVDSGVSCSLTTVKTLRFYARFSLDEVARLGQVKKSVKDELQQAVQLSLEVVAERQFRTPVFIAFVEQLEEAA